MSSSTIASDYEFKFGPKTVITVRALCLDDANELVRDQGHDPDKVSHLSIKALTVGQIARYQKNQRSSKKGGDE